MKTNFLGKDEVRAYLTDFLERLNPPPAVWCPITQSGKDLLRSILDVMPQHSSDQWGGIEIVNIDVDNSGVTWDPETPPERLSGKSVLLLDGAIHSGRMMSLCADEVMKHGASDVFSYALVVKCRSVFIPTLWGIMTADADRTYFLLEKIPNNRLDAGQRPQPPVQLRLLDERHLEVVQVKSGVASIDRVTWGDRYFQMRAVDGTCTYVLERSGVIHGFVTVTIDGSILTIAEIAVDERSRGLGYGGILIRFAETLARHLDCDFVRLNALEARVGFYENEGFKKLDKAPIPLEQEKYLPMEKPILHHHHLSHAGLR